MKDIFKFDLTHLRGDIMGGVTQARTRPRRRDAETPRTKHRPWRRERGEHRIVRDAPNCN